ncbi:hypothetical protein HPP92_003924 [Vanilla planifolia]|uniref:Pectinesterase inhibitor domain-containing protein n=1 Tax=Vanilla planifolia TaxID=51239 RepID=A0A835RZ98_VANPL|nr:hypothetical protein HPP92_004339 [Vanilla planifolia]KAG0503852.1 hypothetical protein HPP92_003924 [Vanilla planifolia]
MDSPPVPLAVFLLLLHQNLLSTATASSIVEPTCKQVVSKGIGFDFCVKTLRKDPKSSTAGARGLAVIATQQTKLEFIHVLNAINKLLHGNVTDADKKALSDCAAVYEDSVETIREAIELIISGSDTDALYYLSALCDYVSTCDDAFGEMGDKLLVAKLDEDARYFASFAFAVTSLVSSH